MRPQTMYRGESKKAKQTKAEKIYTHMAKVKRRAAARKKAEQAA